MVISITPSHVLTIVAKDPVQAALTVLEPYGASKSGSWRQVEDGLWCLWTTLCRPLLSSELRAFEMEYGCSVCCISTAEAELLVDPAVPKLAVFDLDSTLLATEVIDELAAAVPGAGPRVAEITAKSMAGDLDFCASLQARVALLAGLNVQEQWTRLQREDLIMPGARHLIRRLHAHGFECSVVSGGFGPMARWIKDQLTLKSAHANELELDANSQATGRLAPGHSIVDAQAKADTLAALARGCGAQLTLAVGDGANDILMMAAADISVAFNAKARVQECARFRLNYPSLAHIAHLLLPGK